MIALNSFVLLRCANLLSFNITKIITINEMPLRAFQVSI